MNATGTDDIAASRATTGRRRGGIYLRVAVGALLAAHGAHGLRDGLGEYDVLARGYPLDAWSDLLRSLPVLIDGIELGCGLLLAFGYATRAAAVLVLTAILGAVLHAFFATAPQGDAIGPEGAVLWSIVMLFYVLRGTGPSSPTAASMAVRSHVRDTNRLVARLAAMPWFRARLPAASAFARRRMAQRPERSRRPISKSTRRRVP